MNRQEASLEMLKHELASESVRNFGTRNIEESLRRPIDQRQCETSTPCAPRRPFSPLQQMPNLSFKLPSHASTTAISTKLSSKLWNVGKLSPELPVSASRPLRSWKVLPFSHKRLTRKLGTLPHAWRNPLPRLKPSLNRSNHFGTFPEPSLSYSSNAMVFLLLWKNKTQN